MQVLRQQFFNSGNYEWQQMLPRFIVHVVNYTLTKKATGSKSLEINCWEINQVTSKCQTDFLNKTFKKMPKTELKNITIEFYIFEEV